MLTTVADVSCCVLKLLQATRLEVIFGCFIFLLKANRASFRCKYIFSFGFGLLKRISLQNHRACHKNETRYFTSHFYCSKWNKKENETLWFCDCLQFDRKTFACVHDSALNLSCIVRYCFRILIIYGCISLSRAITTHTQQIQRLQFNATLLFKFQ